MLFSGLYIIQDPETPEECWDGSEGKLCYSPSRRMTSGAWTELAGMNAAPYDNILTNNPRPCSIPVSNFRLGTLLEVVGLMEGSVMAVTFLCCQAVKMMW